ncbi:MAG: hypothetical protein AAFQ65_01525 [Myxococcota bacterium]
MQGRIEGSGGPRRVDPDGRSGSEASAGVDIDSLAWQRYRHLDVKAPSRSRLGAALRAMLERDGIIQLGDTTLRASIELPSSAEFSERFHQLDQAGLLPDRMRGDSAKHQAAAHSAVSNPANAGVPLSSLAAPTSGAKRGRRTVGVGARADSGVGRSAGNRVTARADSGTGRSARAGVGAETPGRASVTGTSVRTDAQNVGRARQKLPAQAASAASPVPSESASTAEVRAALVNGGLRPEDAERLARSGLRGSEIDTLLTPELLEPSLADFPQHALVIALFAEARAVGGLTPGRLSELIQASKDWAVVRPDGVLAAVDTGKPSRAYDVYRAEDGRLMAGSLELGRLYFMRSGTLHALEPGFVKNPTVAAEVGRSKGFVGSALDGADEVVIGGFVGTAELGAALYLDFEGTTERIRDGLVQAFKDIPSHFVNVPEYLERLANLPRAEQVKLASKLVTSGALMAIGFGQFKDALKTGSIGGGGGALAGANGSIINLAAIDFAAALSAVGDATAAGALAGLGIAGLVPDTGSLPLDPGSIEPKQDAESLNVESRGLRHANIDRLTPKERFYLDDQARRAGLCDPENPTNSLESLDDSIAIAQAMGERLPISLKWFRQKVERRLRQEVQNLDSLPSDELRKARTDKIRALADELDIDLHKTLQIGGPEVPLSSLSPEAQRIMRDIQRGIEPTGVYTREIAEEVATQFRHYVDTTGWPLSRTKKLLPDSDDQTLHWDDQFGPDGLLKHHGPNNPHAKTPHLQLHRQEKTYRVFFKG